METGTAQRKVVCVTLFDVCIVCVCVCVCVWKEYEAVSTQKVQKQTDEQTNKNDSMGDHSNHTNCN